MKCVAVEDVDRPEGKPYEPCETHDHALKKIVVKQKVQISNIISK